jgi:hypothetical protein
MPACLINRQADLDVDLQSCFLGLNIDMIEMQTCI